jgi:2-aminoadipate transaminase
LANNQRAGPPYAWVMEPVTSDPGGRSGPGQGAQGSPHGISLDPYADRYAARTSGMTVSEIRALFAVASRPEVVSLAGGMPYLAALPMEAISEIVATLVRDRGHEALQYGSGQGDLGLREHICEVMALEGIQASPEDVVVTVGSQHALDLVSRIFLDPGDVVLAEGPSYVGALGTFAAAQAEVVHVAMDDDGLIPEALAETIAAVTASGRRPKLLYTVPNHHNPAGVTLAEERRDAVLAICEQAGVIVLEDNPYGLLGFDAEPLRALRGRESGPTVNTIYLGSFSKTFAPGLRVGWVLAPHAVREKLVLASEAQVLCPPAFSQLTVASYLATQPWKDQIKVYREVYRERRDATLDQLAQSMPEGVSWTRPSGGFYVWLSLPEGLDSKAMLPRAVNARVAYVPGTGFYSDGGGRSHLRLSYCFPPPERIREGVRRLAAVMAEELELRTVFGSPSVQRGGNRSVQTSAPGPDLA